MSLIFEPPLNCSKRNIQWEVIALEQLTSHIEEAHSNRDPGRLACDEYKVHKLHHGDILEVGTTYVNPTLNKINNNNNILEEQKQRNKQLKGSEHFSE